MARAPRPKQPSRAEIELWRAALGGVEPLPGRHRKPSAKTPPSAPEPTSRAAAARRPPPSPLALPALDARSAPGLDKRSAERLKRGQLAVEARIDLHGMTQEAAHRALGGFLARTQEAGKRCVLVITGKGLRRPAEDEWRGAGGVLREAVPRWLNEAPNRARVLAFATAQPKDGGGGALYVLLRRAR